MSKIDYSKYWTSMVGDTAASILKKWVNNKPDKEFIVFRDQRLTWKELDELTAKLASAYLKLGMKKGDRIGIIGPNHVEVLIAWFAAVRVGIVPVPINTRYRKMELEYLIGDSGCKTVFTIGEFGDFQFAKAVHELREKCPDLKNVIVYGSEELNDDSYIYYEGISKQGEIDYKGMEQNEPESSDILMILYTSGTTGVPKGVVHTHDSMLCDSKAYIGEVWHLTDEDVVLLAMPWTHMIGHEIFFNSAFLLGQKVVVMETYNPVMFADLIEKEKVTWFLGVPTMYMLPIIRVPDIGERDFSSFKFGITAGFYAPPEQMKLFKKTYQIDLIQLLGSTEAGAMLMTRRDDPDDVAFNTIGRVVSNKEVKICDESGKEVPKGEVGELLFKGPSIFKYYWNKPDLTKKEKDENGFWHSGDMGRMVDDQGNIQLVSRKKEIIIRGGFNIYPGEIEAFVLNMPEIQMAVLVGYPDKVLGAKTYLNVMLKPGKELSEDELRARFKENLANYKMPDLIKIQSDPLPMLPTGKPDKVTIRSNLLRELGLEDKSL